MALTRGNIIKAIGKPSTDWSTQSLRWETMSGEIKQPRRRYMSGQILVMFPHHKTEQKVFKVEQVTRPDGKGTMFIGRDADGRRVQTIKLAPITNKAGNTPYMWEYV